MSHKLKKSTFVFPSSLYNPWIQTYALPLYKEDLLILNDLSFLVKSMEGGVE